MTCVTLPAPLVVLGLLLLGASAEAQTAPAPEETPPAAASSPPADTSPPTLPPLPPGDTAPAAPTASPDSPAPPSSPPVYAAPPPSADALPPPTETEPAPTVSEGKLLVLAYNTGFQWNISPGVIFAPGQTGFALGVRFGYGIETGPVILVPGVELSGYFLDPNVFVGMPLMKMVLPIDRFAPFIEGGGGVGHITDPAETGLALLGGGGFMVHPSASFAIGAEATYQTIVGTGFHGASIGPILAIAF